MTFSCGEGRNPQSTDFQTDFEAGTNQLLRERYAGSLMDEYSRLSIARYGKQIASDYDLHRGRINDTKDVPPSNAAVIHLRLGDVLETAIESVSDMLREQQSYYRENQNVKRCRCELPWKNPTGAPLLRSWTAYVRRPLSYFSSIDWKPYFICRHHGIGAFGSQCGEYDGRHRDIKYVKSREK